MGLNVGVYVKKDVLILRLKGELDDLSVSDLRMRISKYISDYSIVHLVINVKDLNFLDSSGIGFIIGRYHQLKKQVAILRSAIFMRRLNGSSTSPVWLRFAK